MSVSLSRQGFLAVGLLICLASLATFVLPAAPAFAGFTPTPTPLPPTATALPPTATPKPSTPSQDKPTPTSTPSPTPLVPLMPATGPWDPTGALLPAMVGAITILVLVVGATLLRPHSAE